MMVKTLPPSSRTSQEDSRGGELSVIEVIAEQSTQKVIKSAEASRQPRHKARVMAGLEPETVLYDPVEIETQYNGRFLQVIRRIFTVLKPILAFILGLWSDKRWGTLVKNERRRAVQLRDLLTKLGPAYIKIGQALSTRPDLVPPIYLEELTRLQDQLPAFPNEIAYQFIEEELGAPPSEIYAELSSQPIAAASLGQVYQGRLKTGEEVAIKVQRPDLRERITIDLYILRKLAAWVQRNIKRVRSDLVGILDELGDRIFEEMDYIHEGENAERFFELYGNMKDIYVPKIYWEYTNRRVLTMEWINGIKLTQPEKIAALGVNARYLIEVGVQCSLRQLLEHGFFHADPHPGNLLATMDGKLAYLDFGMMSEVKPAQRYGLIEAIVHVVNREFDSLAKDYVKLEFLTPETDLTPIIPAFAKVFANAEGASVADLNIKSITDDLSALMYEYPFRVPPYYALIIRSLVTLEGIAIYIDPNFKVLSEAYPYVAKRLLTDPADELRTSLQELLFKDGKFRWNRLENLLKNARSNQEYDLNLVVNQGVEFLSSKRGSFIRDRLIDEFFNSVDAVSKNALHNFTYVLRERVGITAINQIPSASVEQQQTLEYIKRIAGILRETKGFDATKFAPQLAQIIVNPGVQLLGQQIATRVTQKAVTRIIRELLASE
ncbi:AarF/ABC1/UbiB kinase family protein [Aphanizomenon flos-aquae NRERC-008]|jgi:predicted unusual protein kinase regulating ubiquinone biosynthesis (AarF/ABC1/UbiB family)|uniref:AarF/ABC1/UbiB kinase family protein n=1 Tax=Aphanizomenon flos-aquae FACHB-1249 TaxID=2692889 RepID=A0ABR8IQI6_APHFL|nr:MULTISPECIES: AarF/ABC1/UbiB kinase family protein [Aphanizomenon]MBD2390141.1 AarF/ABC1/UbiB kinase family protein [Aphanizomenon flos-aquae FACHB-1171]MBD2556565.1 AarF/ABC1/UbiB kinase family protein [Aphanizomenon flos-aquae FACHB-1290]MBD2631145.1 AarF/ABC1/UbiB kinase family protein [Aphanizomenon sp. FACHB-1399]MBD2642039.1 AarF/ABC1/UbiB kinase family protein [Aphanizomenon sp. FACHB-1401]MBD2657021.1 AarF/ABC1/UbiB kinase family protein [Aphanizomenon flos-aquae FACHB-1265]